MSVNSNNSLECIQTQYVHDSGSGNEFDCFTRKSTNGTLDNSCSVCKNRDLLPLEGGLCRVPVDGNATNRDCVDGKFLNPARNCEICSPMCKTCEFAHNHCTSCHSQYIWHEDNTCQCGPGFFFEDASNKCKQCTDKNCKTCDQTGTCVTCLDSFVMFEDENDGGSITCKPQLFCSDMQYFDS